VTSDGRTTLEGAKILVVGRDYFFYTREIASELRSACGAQALFVPIEPAARLFRGLRKFGSIRRRLLRRYHERRLRELHGHAFDIVLFIQVHQIGDFIGRYRAAFPTARFVLYYWDSLRTHDYLPAVPWFDSVVTFDPEDARRHPGFRYLPLFYTEAFSRLRDRTPTRCDISFVGVAVSMVRYEQVERFRALARARGLVLEDYVVVSPLLYFRMLLRGRRLRGVHFRSLPQHRLLEIYAGSHAVLDLTNNTQSGYTMRTFECLGSHRKLVTTNARIRGEDFYSPGCVQVIEGDDVLPGDEFFAAAATFPSTIDNYSLRAWLQNLLLPALN
jgi:hypothetical protein